MSQRASEIAQLLKSGLAKNTVSSQMGQTCQEQGTSSIARGQRTIVSLLGTADKRFTVAGIEKKAPLVLIGK